MENEKEIKELCSLATYFRLGRSLEVTDDVIALLSLITSRIAAKNPRNMASMQAILSSILTCQDNEDWIGFADYIEYDLPNFCKKLDGCRTPS